MQYVYHFKRKNMQGNILYPLNVLKNMFPEAFEAHKLKYEGREHILQKVIPILDCLWNDVLHISPINPQLILDTLKNNNLVSKGKERKIFETYRIPVACLEDMNTVCFQSFNYDSNNFDPKFNKYWKFNSKEYLEQKEVSPKQIEIWHKDKQEGRQLFWYSHTMHILSKQSIDVSKIDIIECS